MAVLHSRIAAAIMVALMLGGLAGCDPKKTAPKPTTGAGGDTAASAPR